MANKWADWLHTPCHQWFFQHFKAGDKIRSGPEVGLVATYPMPPGGFPTLQGMGQNQQWPTTGPSGYIPPTVRGVPDVHSGGPNQKWHTSGPSGYITLEISGVPYASH